jgi:hypothetical protein
MVIAFLNAVTFFVRRYRLHFWAVANAPDISTKGSLSEAFGGDGEFGIAQQQQQPADSLSGIQPQSHQKEDQESEQALQDELEHHETIMGQKEQQLVGEHVGFFLLISYLVLPPASRIQLQALDCVQLKGSGRFLRADTSVDCDSESYAAFAAYDYVLLACFLSIPLVWASFLWSKRRQLNPMAFPPLLSKDETDPGSAAMGGGGGGGKNNGGPEQSDWVKAEDRELVLLAERDAEPSLKPYKFLFHVYSLDFFWFECLEM